MTSPKHPPINADVGAPPPRQQELEKMQNDVERQYTGKSNQAGGTERETPSVDDANIEREPGRNPDEQPDQQQTTDKTRKDKVA
jgi:hypothetical protein